MASVGPHAVHGKVLDTDGQPFVDCLIRAIRVELSASTLADATTLVHESQLVDTTTDSDGIYTMTFTITPGPGRRNFECQNKWFETQPTAYPE
jgi:hypothetical protein